MLRAIAILFALTAAGAASAQVAPSVIVSPVDPLTMASDDFTRLATPALWNGLTVTRVEFRDDRTFWRLYRIVNRRKPAGPLWFVPHDNENAAFQAAIYALRAYGGEAVVVEEARSIANRDRKISVPEADTRLNSDVDYGNYVDPNRNFRDAQSPYVRQVLAGLGTPPRLIVALHTNQPGYDARESRCGPPPPINTGDGEISVLLCNDTYSPRPSVAARWPFDDTDSMAIVAYPVDGAPDDGFCARPLATADANIQFEHVVTSDGSLSNYSLFRGWPYVNFETQDRGVTPEGLGDARSRLLAMIDTAMAQCAPVEGVSLRIAPPRQYRR